MPHSFQDIIAAYGEDVQIAFAADYGDRAHTQQALSLDNTYECLPLAASAYSNSGWAIDRDADEMDEEDSNRALKVVVLGWRW